MFKFLFVSANQGGGGSEELWIQSASILAREGHHVTALTEWNQSVRRRRDQLNGSGIEQESLAVTDSIPKKVLRKCLGNRDPGVAILIRKLKQVKPNLVIFNSGTLLDGLQYLDAIHANAFPCVALTHLVSTDNWPDDLTASRITNGFSMCREACFVSEHNRKLCFLQTGNEMPNSKIVRNPFLVTGEPSLMPPIEPLGLVKLALPARLHPRTKGHDILFEVLSRPHWEKRNVIVSLFGTGGCEKTLRLLREKMGLQNKIIFGGHAEDMNLVWREHHGLILPSRHEGLPIAQVEAMWAGRVVIATPAGGISEVMRPGETGFLAKSCDADALDSALTQAWSRIMDWPQIGWQASQHIRTIIQADPAKLWAEHLLELAGQV